MRIGLGSFATAVGLLCGAILVAHAAAKRTYRIVPSESTLTIHVGKSGILKGFGHEHEAVARKLSGQVELAADMTQSRVSITVDSTSLEVQPGGEPAGDAPKVQETMLGPSVLDVAHHPAIVFRSNAVTAKPTGDGAFDAEVSGVLELRGTARSIKVPLRLELADGQLRAHGSTTLRQSDFGIEPVRAAGGSVRVKDEVALRFSLVAR